LSDIRFSSSAVGLIAKASSSLTQPCQTDG
jgi:hypothetical protein